MTGTDPSLNACIYLAPHRATGSHLPLDGLDMHVIHGCCSPACHVDAHIRGRTGQQWQTADPCVHRPLGATIHHRRICKASVLNAEHSKTWLANCTFIMGMHMGSGEACS